MIGVESENIAHIAAADPTVHGIAADAGFAEGLGGVGGTMVDVGVVAVGKEFALAEEALIGGFEGIGHGAEHPGIAGGDGVGRQSFESSGDVIYEAAIVVGGVHLKAQTELAEIIHASGLHTLGLGAGKRGQKEPGEDGDNRDNNKEFDECEGFQSMPL
ncbi:MAG: hypothetical protein JWQ71_3054 [Pedosphaera sp.]|nr:hypothetical protein [Pedosphaera sp.]